MKLFRAMTRGAVEDADLRALFRFIDVDQSNTVERSELRALLDVHKQRLTESQMDNILGGKGVESVDFETFCRAMRRYADLLPKLRTSYRVFFVCGGPGSGKGTICSKLVERRGGLLDHVSSGDLLRDEVKRGTELGKHVDGLMRSGALVSASVVLALLDSRLKGEGLRRLSPLAVLVVLPLRPFVVSSVLLWLVRARLGSVGLSVCCTCLFFHLPSFFLLCKNWQKRVWRKGCAARRVSQKLIKRRGLFALLWARRGSDLL